MQKYIAVAIALIVVLGAFFGREQVISFFTNLPHQAATTTPGSLINFTVPVITLSSIKDGPVSIEAWNVFDQYRNAAKAHDLAQLKALSYQLSPECTAALTDSTKMAKCTELMDSVAFFTQDFQAKDFIRVAYDAKQIVLTTDYLKIADAEEPVKTVIYFVRDPSPKVLGIRFCIGAEGKTEECVQTAPDKRDTNGNGWWDDVEALFKK